MKCRFLILLILIFHFSVDLFAQRKEQQLDLMPIPEKIILSEGKFRLDDSFTISVIGEGSDKLFKYSTRTLRRLADRTGFFFHQEYITKKSKIDTANFIISFNRIGKAILNEDESYQLTISSQNIKLSAETEIGAFRGFETFLQLLSVDEEGYYFPALRINDKPRFPWRGLLIDSGRHFMPVDVIKRNLDGMAAVKLNVLHWHLTEDQGFRVECKTFPKLHELGSDGFYYKQTQIKDIIQYAADRGIRVMPEFDIPGHATSWFVGYPEYASAPGPYTIERTWGIKDPTFNPTIEKTYDFFDAFFKEMSQLFTDDYLHIGGDENNGKQWDTNQQIQEFMKENNIADNHALQSYFNKRILAILTKYNKKMVGWDEIFQPDMPTNIVIHSWRGKDAMVDAAQKGYQTILSNGYYIDLIQPTDFHYLNDPIPEDSQLLNVEKKFIFGGEATMWSEYVGPETIDSRIWPRTAAIAERFWSPGSVKDVDDMYRRLKTVSFWLEELDLLHEKNFEMMLRKLSNNQDSTPLRNFINVIEPVKRYNRGRLRPHTQQSPLNRVVDAAKPDAEVARVFRKNVDEFLDKKNTSLSKLIKRWLVLWRENHNDLEEIIKISPILKEIEILSADLSKCAIIGLEALDYLEKQKQTDEEWIQLRLDMLEKIKQPRGQTELMIVSAIEKLVKATNR